MDSSPWPGPLALVGLAAPAAATAQQFTGRDWGLLIGLLISLVIAGLASASETALTSVSRIRIRTMSDEGDPRARLIERLLRDPNAYLSTILILNSVAVIVASTLATLIALDVFASFGEVISTVVLALIVLIFCEITPKTAALQSPVRWATALVRPVYGASIVLRPIVRALTALTNGLIRILGGHTAPRGPFMSEAELRLLVDESQREGVLEEDEKEIIHNVFEFADTTVRSVMIPRIDMITVEADEPVDAAIKLMLQGGQSRIPVYSDTIDNIIGVLYAKDLLRELAADRHPANVRALVRPAYFVVETKRLDDLLTELRAQKVHMAIVTDEFSQVAGLVTLEDLVEEIIGPIQDEYDTEEADFEQVGPDEFIVAAKISIDDFNDLLNADLPSDDYDTLAGFIYAQLDKIPSAGDTVRFDHLAFTVLGTRGRRIVKVRVVREQPALPAPSDEGAAQLNGRDHGNGHAQAQVHAAEQAPAPLPEATPPLALPPAGATSTPGEPATPATPDAPDALDAPDAPDDAARPRVMDGAHADPAPTPFVAAERRDEPATREPRDIPPDAPHPARHRQPVSRHGHGRGGSSARRR